MTGSVQARRKHKGIQLPYHPRSAVKATADLGLGDNKDEGAAVPLSVPPDYHKMVREIRRATVVGS